jgi:hypothetical protein
MWDIPWMGELSGYPATNPQKHQEFNVAEAFLAAADEIQCQGPLEIGVALASALRPVFHILIVTCSTTKPVFGGLTSNNTTKLANMVGISWEYHGIMMIYPLVSSDVAGKPPFHRESRWEVSLGESSKPRLMCDFPATFDDTRVNHHSPIIIP